jgi:hypothetical protein
MALKMVEQYGNFYRKVKVYRDSEYGEYIVRLFVNNVHYAAADYFDSDKQSAIDTGLQMLLTDGSL